MPRASRHALCGRTRRRHRQRGWWHAGMIRWKHGVNLSTPPAHERGDSHGVGGQLGGTGSASRASACVPSTSAIQLRSSRLGALAIARSNTSPSADPGSRQSNRQQRRAKAVGC